MPRPKGLQKTGGRAKGTTNKRTQQFQAAVAQSGLSPLQFMLRVMNDERADFELRARVAAAAAPYIHPRLSAVEAKIEAHHFRMSPQEQRRLIDAVDRLDSILDGRVIDMG